MDQGERLSRQAISDAVGEHGWRFVLGSLHCGIAVGSLAEAADVASLAVTACGLDAGDRLRIDLRADRVLLRLQTLEVNWVTAADIDAARRVTVAVGERGLLTEAGGEPRSVQALEIAIDALDIASVLPFWRAVLGYATEPGGDGPPDSVADPLGQGPTVWFQQMDEPRPQRNRIHFDVSVPHDEASRRLAAALDAGGTLLSDAAAPSFWVLADPEGNEACVTTWQGRD